MKKAISPIRVLALSAAFASQVFASSMCVELCTPCSENAGDTTCAKVESLCNCAAVMDSINTVASEISKNKQQLAMELLGSCDQAACQSTIHFADGKFTSTEVTSSSAKLERLKEKHARDADLQIPADSAEALQAKVMRLEQSRVLADKAFDICGGQGSCTVDVLYLNSMEIVEIKEVEAEAIATNDSAAVLQTEEQPTTQTEKIAQPEQPEQPQGNDQKAAPANPNQKNLYKGVALSYGYFIERDYLRLGIHGYDGENNYDGAITWLMRWYFYSAGSLQAGLGVSYHHAEYYSDKYKFLGNIDYYEIDWFYGSYNGSYERRESVYLSIDGEEHTISLEIPLTLRLGIPFAKGFAPYASGTFMVRKPIYGWADVDVDDWWFTEDDTGMKSDFYSDEDWEFVGWLGFGVEFTRHFSVEYQMMLFSTSTGIGHEYYPEDSWRVNLQFAW